MRQFDRAAVQAFLREAAAGGRPRRELAAADGSRLVYEHDPAPGVTASLTEVGPDGTARVRQRTFAPAAAPPAGYPAGAPFVAGRAVRAGALGDAGDYTLTWETPDDPAPLVAEVVRASAAAGWAEADAPGGVPGGAGARDVVAAALRGAMGAMGAMGASFALRRLVRDGRQRLVTGGARGGRGGYVTLAEAPERAGRAGAAPGAT